MRKIGFVILTWNSEKYIAGCLRPVFEADPELFQNTVVVVDNGSEDRTVEAIMDEKKHYQGSHHQLDVIRLKKNEGTTRSRNHGIKKLLSMIPKPEFICILDSDTEINEAALQTMTDVLTNEPRIGIIGPRMHNAVGIYQISGKNFSTLSGKLLKVMPIRFLRERGECMETMIPAQGNGCASVGYLISACWLMRREVYERLGPLDEKIFYAPEDLEYCIRCWKQGYHVVYCYDADVLHYWQRLSRKKLFSKHNFEQIRALIHVFIRYHYVFSAEKLWRDIRMDSL